VAEKPAPCQRNVALAKCLAGFAKGLQPNRRVQRSTA